MTKSGFDRPRRNTLSRRGVLGLASAGTVFTFWQRKAHGLPAPERFFDRLATERIADRDPARTPILVDAQTHVWWRAGGIRQMSERGEHFLKSLAGSRAAVVGHPVPVADMGRVMFLEDVFLDSETDIAFLNSFGMRAAFDGVDLFPPREAAFIRSMAPSRIRVLGTVDPPDGASAIESLIYQCETIKIDGLIREPLNKGLEHGRVAWQFAHGRLYGIIRACWEPYWASVRFTGLVADTLRPLAAQ